VASYRLFIKPSAVREIEALPFRLRQRIVTRIRGLTAAPRPPGCEKLAATTAYRIRQGKYRILYTIDDSDEVVRVIRVGHRKEVYR
jgi:mRNA interferase RelE/StbE